MRCRRCLQVRSNQRLWLSEGGHHRDRDSATFMAEIQSKLEEEEGLIGRVHFSKTARKEHYLPSPLCLSGRVISYGSSSPPPPETPALSASTSSPPSHFPSSSPYSEKRRNSSEFNWDYSLNHDLDDAPPLTATASDYSELEDTSDISSEGNSPKTVKSESSLPKARYRESSDTLIAAEALILFSHRPLEMLAGPSTASPISVGHNNVEKDASVLNKPLDDSATASQDFFSHDMITNDRQAFVDTGEAPSSPLRPETPETQRPHFKRFLSNISTTSLVTSASPSHRPRKKRCPSHDRCEIPLSPTSCPEDQLITFDSKELVPEHLSKKQSPNRDLPVENEGDDGTGPTDTACSPDTVDSRSPCISYEELQGHIISILALSRSSSMTISAVVKQLLSNEPGLLSHKSKHEWNDVIREILDDNNGGKPVFSRVERVGKDAASRRLENQYYYNPESDPDQGRAEILREMVPKKRGVTKQHRQYYFEPVSKSTTKWDPEGNF